MFAVFVSNKTFGNVMTTHEQEFTETNITSASVEVLLSEILKTLKTTQNWKKLWTIDDLVEYFQASRSTVSRKIVSRQDFPVAIRIDGGVPRWKPNEVERWAERQREKRPVK
jgi:predicted DNA-binding transcriptional regulator AlpA